MLGAMLATVQFMINQIAQRDVEKDFAKNKGSGTERGMSSWQLVGACTACKWINPLIALCFSIK